MATADNAETYYTAHNGYNQPADKNTYADPEAVVAQQYEDFRNKSIRMGFIRKVYGILSVQLAITFGITFLFVLNESVKTWVQTHPGAMWSAIGLSIAFIIALTCCGNIARKVPLNYILLFSFTLVEAYLIGTISSTYDTDVVLIAFGITIGVSLGLTVFAWQTKIDFTTMSGVLFSLLWSVIIFGFLNIWFHSRVLNLVYAWLGALVFSLYIVYDTQLIVGGKHKHEFSPDDYIFAALNLYLDVVNLFLYILRILGSSRK